jgi:hypothetical protein
MQSEQFAADKPDIIKYGIHASDQAEVTIFKQAGTKSDVRNI